MFRTVGKKNGLFLGKKDGSLQNSVQKKILSSDCKNKLLILSFI